MTNTSTKTNMDERKKSMNVKIVRVVLIEKTVVRKKKETELHWQWPMQFCYLETIFTAPSSFFPMCVPAVACACVPAVACANYLRYIFACSSVLISVFGPCPV